jgi:hypothetical protein
LAQAHVVPALDHFAGFDFVGVADVLVSHCSSLPYFNCSNVLNPD